MLQRAASNAYSWWWASHVRTKQSKWLEHNLQEMEEKVKYMLEIIDEDGDSFAKRAEMYYRRRPELIGFVEDSFRAYRALVERYDHISRELQNANRTIATVYPEEAQFAMDDEGDTSSEISNPSPSSDVNKPTKALPAVPKAEFPKKMPSLRRNYTKSFSRKGQLKRGPSSFITPSSGLSKSEALEEIDKLQKGILALQTEKEFVKSSYGRSLEKYWEIENQITEMQGRVCKLQDEFGVGIVIEDDEARNLMAATALKSCQDSLKRLEVKQEESAKEVREEYEKIKAYHEKLKNYKGMDSNDSLLEKLEDTLQSSTIDQQEGSELSRCKEKGTVEFDLDSASSLNMTEMAEKIDDVVNKVVNLETVLSSEEALVKRLRSGTRELQTHIQSLEEDNETLTEGSDSMSAKLQELAEELRRVKSLNKRAEDQHRNLQNNIVEANRYVSHLTEALQNVKPDEDLENGALFQDAKRASRKKATVAHVDAADTGNDSGMNTEEKEEDGVRDEEAKEERISKPRTSSVESNKEDQEDDSVVDYTPSTQSNLDVLSEMSQDGATDVEESQGPREKLDEEEPSWRRLMSTDFEEREKILLEEYSTILHDYREAKKKLSEVEKKKRETLFESAMQIRELRNSNALKDEEIQALRHRLKGSHAHSDQSLDKKSLIEFQSQLGLARSNFPSASQQSLMDLLRRPALESSTKSAFSKANAASIEEKVRNDIDSLLEDNLDFWLRFSTSYHQIPKFQTSIHDLKSDLFKLNQTSYNTPRSNHQKSVLKADARAIYRHLREIQTELTLWLEQNVVLKDELKSRLSSLSSIQEELARVSNAGPGAAEQGPPLDDYQAAVFHGEIMNMKQENNKVADELRAGLERVRRLQMETEKTLRKMDDEFGFSSGKSAHHPVHGKQPTQKNSVPLRSFLFGVKLKKQKPSIFSCMSPALHKQHSDMEDGFH